ncbi:MAG TPA: hypothetical protein DGR97_11190 [Gammaproteobacteria bacterium]|nr:hypothetical protein [Gammaproteobacteria bacterium]
MDGGNRVHTRNDAREINHHGCGELFSLRFFVWPTTKVFYATYREALMDICHVGDYVAGILYNYDLKTV